jgi:hypothetical protein
MDIPSLKPVTVVSAISFLGFAPGYLRADQARSTKFKSGIYFTPSGCNPANGNLLADFCKQATEVDSDAFYTAIFS